MSDSPPDFSDLLTKQANFSACIKVAQQSIDTDAPRVDHLFLRFKESIPDENSLAEAICHQVINYAIPRRKIREILARIENPLDLSEHSKILSEAKRAFIKFDSKATGSKANIRYGEIGEVIAFCVASHFLEAGQVAAKMALKTNSQMPIFGLDGIHVRGEKDGTITVFFLESKVVGDAKSGGSQYADSAGGFDQDRAHKLNEDRIARDLSNFDLFEGSIREAALEYFNPYGEASENVRERFVGVIVYSEAAYQKKIPVNDATPLKAHEANFLTHYSAGHAGILVSLKQSLENKKAEAGRCRAFFLAVPDSAKLKGLFAKEMANDHIR
jgi:hypothetical protein